MYYGNQQFLFVYEQFDDVRPGGRPPRSIGKFGDTDNWIWPPRATSRCSASMPAGLTNPRPIARQRTNPSGISISTARMEGDFGYGFPATRRSTFSPTPWPIAERSDPASRPHGQNRHHLGGAARRSGAAHPPRRQTLDRQRMEMGRVLGINRLGTVAEARLRAGLRGVGAGQTEYRSVVADLKADTAASRTPTSHARSCGPRRLAAPPRTAK